MRLSIANAFRGLLVALMAGHGFFMYCLARSMGESFGATPGVVALAGLFTAVMMLPLAWAVAIPELPEAYRWLRNHRRWRDGRCSTCGYVVRESESDVCSECAEPIVEPEPYRFSLGTVRRFAIMVVTAWLLGASTGELWTTHDERLFEREVEARLANGVSDSYARARRWPMETASLVYAEDGTFLAND